MSATDQESLTAGEFGHSASLVRVLLVEDNPADARLIREMLREETSVRFDLAVRERLSGGLAFLNGEEDAPGTSLEHGDRCDVVLLDLGLPDSRGLDTFEAVHRTAPGTPVVVLTGLEDDRTGFQAIEAGAQDFLVKGRVDSTLLVRTMRYAMERNRLIDALRRKTEALEFSRRSFQGIVEKSADGIVVVDREGVVRFLNLTAMEQFRMDRDLLTTHRFGLPVVSGDMTEVDILRTDGSYGLAEMRAVDTEWDGKPAFLAMLRDITERKEAEDRLVRQEKLAALGKLSSMVGHEIRTPLGTIRNAIEFIRLRLAKTLDEKVSRHLRILEEETGNIDRIIDDILGFARTRELDLDEIDPREIAEGTLKEVHLPEGIRVVREFAPGLAAVTVDRLQVRRAFRNLFLNAVEAMPEGGVLTIRVDRVDQSDGRAFETRFEVRDTGEGIPRGLREKIFEPLFTTKSKGTGLGLATVQSVVLAHRGRIELESRKGEGTTFTIFLPGFGGS